MSNENIRTAEEIAAQNDFFRKNLGLGFNVKVNYTRSVANSSNLSEILAAVANYSDFSSSNDPYGEHDFGKFSIQGVDYFFKFEYFDKKMEYGVNPYISEECVRVLTIMEASEY